VTVGGCFADELARELWLNDSLLSSSVSGLGLH
jgi:hypothetical protein